MMYVSWNGATEVKSWRFYGGDSKQGPWEEIAQVPKTGFESSYRHQSTYAYNYAEALDKDGQVLGASAVEATFIPNEQMKDYCDEIACRFMPTPQQRQQEKEQKENAQRIQEEQEEQERLEAERLHEERIKNAEIYGVTFGGLAVLVILIIVLATRNFVSRPLHVLAHNALRAVRKRAGGKGGRDLGVGAGYKALSVEDQDGDRVPMIMDPS